MRTPVRGVHHTEECREDSLLGIAGVLDAVDNGSPVRTETLHFTRNDFVSSVEPLIAAKGKEEEGSFAEFVGSINFERETNAVDE